MPTRLRSALPHYRAGWPASRRTLTAALAVAGLLVITVLTALLASHNNQHENGRRPSEARPSHAQSRTPRVTASGGGSVPAPAQIADPVAYSRAAAAMLWSYDTRDISRDQQLAGMNAWMTRETKYTDWASVSAQVPDPVLWSRMADNGQYATAKVTDAYFPSAFKQALADDPSALTEAYIYAVTVTGTQQIAWKQGGGGAEERTVTLAVQCRPSHDCSLVSIAPRVAP